MININNDGQKKGGDPKTNVNVPMVWDKILNKLVPVNHDSFAADVQA
jgi:hypothetical protein